MKLESDTIRLRAVEPSDIDILYLWENDPEIWTVGESITPYSRYELEKYILSEGDIFANKQLRLMIDCKKNDGYHTVGTIDLFDFNPVHGRAGLGILIYLPENRKKGYASESLNILIEYAFTVLNLRVLYCNISAGNRTSVRCFEKAGFKKCGIKRSWNNTPNGREDEIMLQLIRKEND
ncbi:MAG: GNAT family N-acetyltransferase [Prevotellaceae bacterium]|jgi:diamine N-acetyltransferase|nr:GNAT family N-acetyltransferase [Prevotellaceae bacterium]